MCVDFDLTSNPIMQHHREVKHAVIEGPQVHTDTKLFFLPNVITARSTLLFCLAKKNNVDREGRAGKGGRLRTFLWSH